jgi:branched-chain amino acid transport system permease protein
VQSLKNLWRSPSFGLGFKALALLALLPGFFSLIGDAPPLGIYLQGAIVGCMHALIAIGLILVYRSNRVINFAQASLGATPVVLAVLLMQRRNYPYWQAVLITVIGSLLLGALVEFVFIRRFNKSPRLILTLATIGIAQFLGFFEVGLSLAGWVRGDAAVQGSASRIVTPFSDARAEIGSVNFSGDHLVTVLLVLVLALGLGAFFRYTNIGMAVRASAENADRAALMGIPVRRVRTIVWVIAGLLSGVGVFQRSILIGSLPAGLTGATTLLYGLAPAVIARMTSIPTAIVAGLGIGIIDVGVFYSTRNATLSTALVLPIVVLALLMQRSKLSRAEDSGVETWRQVKEVRPVPDELKGERSVIIGTWVVRAIFAGLVLALPYLTGTGRTDLASVLIVYAIAGVSLVILTGWAGQISLGQFAFVGVGAAVAGGLVANHGIDLITALFAAGLVGAALSLLIGLPAVRLPGLFLAVTTLAFAANTQYFFLQKRYFGWLLPKDGEFVERPMLWGRIDLRGDHAFYYTCLFFFVLAAASARSIRSHRSGRVMMAVRDNPRSAQSYGISATTARLAAFAISGFFAAVAGGLFAHIQGVVDPNQFSPSQSLQIFAMCVIGGLTSVGGALVGALYVLGFQYFLPDYSLLASGMGMLLLLLFFPGGLSELGINLRDAFLRRVAIKKGIHVPSLLADSLQLNEEQEESEEEMFDEIAADQRELAQTGAKK